jgi:hypothetical protein
MEDIVMISTGNKSICSYLRVLISMSLWCQHSDNIPIGSYGTETNYDSQFSPFFCRTTYLL